MRKLWEFWKKKDYDKKHTVALFLLTNAMIWGVAGAVLWMLTSLVALREISWLVVFIGYAVVFPGFLGGMLFTMNREKELNEF